MGVIRCSSFHDVVGMKTVSELEITSDSLTLQLLISPLAQGLFR